MKKLFISILVLFLGFNALAQDPGYHFKPVVDLEATTVKSQGRTGTCWCFSTISFLESELLRMGKPDYDLSEMYIVKKAYEEKARLYVGNHGMANFSQGGQAHDVLNEMVDHGLVPESVYPGIQYSAEVHNHAELSTGLKYFLDGVLKAGQPTTVWQEAFRAILDVYLGEDPETFTYQGKEYTPTSFANDLGLNPEDYVEIMSYTHVPYYEKAPLLVPDNWSKDDYYNVPLDELIEIMNYSLTEGYTFVWDGDMSDKGFTREGSIAVVENEEDEERLYLTQPVQEKIIDQEYRQEQFETFNITDDHLMHITGLAEDQNGTVYYKTKNSWGTDHKYEGYWYMSEQFMRLHSVAIMVHKDAIPKNIRKKLDL
ncbi:MAG: C1 family peptidase [Bacteroidales bacterium]|jgi:bleomycin hydrolase|nr:C1 family peptidase [Bacteroidales bacterium]